MSCELSLDELPAKCPECGGTEFLRVGFDFEGNELIVELRVSETEGDE